MYYVPSYLAIYLNSNVFYAFERPIFIKNSIYLQKLKSRQGNDDELTITPRWSRPAYLGCYSDSPNLEYIYVFLCCTESAGGADGEIKGRKEKRVRVVGNVRAKGSR